MPGRAQVEAGSWAPPEDQPSAGRAGASDPTPAGGAGEADLRMGAVTVRLYGPPADNSDPCPVKPLGKAGDRLIVMSPGGEILELNARANANQLVLLFDGHDGWLWRNFNRLTKDGLPTRDFVLKNVFSWLVRQCRAVGIWDPATQTRGVGVWRGPQAGGRAVPVAHCGDHVFLAPAAASGDAPARGPGDEADGWSSDTGVWKNPGWQHDKVVYVARPAMPRPDLEQAATAADGARLKEALQMWAWSQGHEPDLLLGWAAAALLGGYPAWRVHAQISAEFGSGKSTLLKLLSGVLGPMGKTLSDVTEAFVRASFANEGRVGVLDEQEQESGTEGKMARLIALLRKMAGDEGAQIGRGSADQQAHQTTVSGCALMAGILPPPLQPADRSRFLRLELRKVTGGDSGKVARIEAEIAWAKAKSGAFRARALLHWSRFADCQQLYRSLVIDAAKGDGRQADLLSVLLAGRELLLRNAMPTHDEQIEAINLIRPLLSSMKDADVESSTAQLCWNHLLSYDTPDRRGGEVQNIGNMIAFARGEPSGVHAATLPRFGLRLVQVDAETANKFPHLKKGTDWLLVANNHGGLHRIFTGAIGSRWSGGNWTVSLKQLGDDVIAWPKPERFAGLKSRAIAIPAEHLPPALQTSAPPAGGEPGSQEDMI